MQESTVFDVRKTASLVSHADMTFGTHACGVLLAVTMSKCLLLKYHLQLHVSLACWNCIALHVMLLAVALAACDLHLIQVVVASHLGTCRLHLDSSCAHPIGL